ncbi:MAG: hypothetical protein HQM12_16640 [SAR324 cluster bacterium]|nr:hypothetical protein [SAR324 cluster bacterium]MBF0351440.1 hypothetical protein [SAR324 cluster bacterium]
MIKVEELQKVVQDAINKGATTVEEVHKKISSLPFEMLEKIGPIAAQVKGAKEKHDQTIGSVYDTIRQINEKAGELAADLLKKVSK